MKKDFLNIAIITGNRNSWSWAVTRSLRELLEERGERCTLYHHTTSWMVKGDRPNLKSWGKALGSRLVYSRFRRFDLIVVVETLPKAFEPAFDIERLRAMAAGVPIVLSNNMFLLTRPHVMEGLKQSGGYGLERYDHYLCTSVHSWHPLPRGHLPYSRIGLRLNQKLLKPEPRREFSALLDFPRAGQEETRAAQIRVLQRLKIPYRELSGNYSHEQICALYRASSIFFLSFGESFGIPICEVQACGCAVATPKASWCAAHLLKADIFEPGAGPTTDNFVVYKDERDLESRLDLFRKNYHPEAVFSTFKATFPHYLNGDFDEMTRFLHAVRAGKINATSHRKHSALNHSADLPTQTSAQPRSARILARNEPCASLVLR